MFIPDAIDSKTSLNRCQSVKGKSVHPFFRCASLWVGSLALVALAGCVAESKSEPSSESTNPPPSSIVSKASLPTGDFNCPHGGARIDYGIDDNSNGNLDPAEVDGSEFVCNGEPGADGATGLSSLVSVSNEPAGINCLIGGIRIDTGVDDNDNGTLNLAEIDASEYLCNGAPGADGVQGDDGLKSLELITDEPAGANCQSGGLRIDTGIDDNNDGTLDTAEVVATNYVCNGTDATAGDKPPVIHSVHGNPALVTPGGSVQLRVSASDPDQDQLAYAWHNVTTNTDLVGTGETITVTTGGSVGTEVYRVIATANGLSATGFVSVIIQAKGEVATSPIEVVSLDSKSVFLPPGFTTPTTTTTTGDFTGTPLLGGDAGEIAGFIAETTALNGELNASEVLSTAVTALGSLGTLSNISQNNCAAGTDGVVAHYQFTLSTADTPTDLANALTALIGLNVSSGSVAGLPTAPAGSPSGTSYRFAITIQYFSATSVVLMVNVVTDAEYATYQNMIAALGDCTNVGGIGDSRRTETDNFTGSGSGGLADILFVVDNSGSMFEEQTAVSLAATEFVSAMSSSGLDFKMGVITTDSDVLRGNGFTSDTAAFQTDVVAGTSGSATETGIWFAEQALQSTVAGDSTNGTVTAAGYPRASSSLSVIILSDEASQYTARSGGGTFDVSSNLFMTRGYRVYAIVNESDAGSSQYDDLAAATGGSTASITATGTFPAIMLQIASDAGGAASSNVLTYTPISSTIAVYVDGVQVANDPSNGWRYFGSSNSIVFYGSAIPAENAAIQVVYDRIVRTSVGSGISAQAGNGQVTLAWDFLPDATAYHLYWATTTGVTPSNGTKIANISSPYVHSGLPNGGAYYYVLTAVVGGVEGEPSDQVTATPQSVFLYDFDDGTLQGWTATGSWGVTTANANAGAYSVTDSPSGGYGNGADMSITSPVLDLSGSSAPSLTFYHRLDLETSWDYGRVLVSTNGGSTFTEIASYTGFTTIFNQESFDLSSYISSQVVIRFQFTSDGSVTYDGWYIDDIIVTP